MKRIKNGYGLVVLGIVMVVTFLCFNRAYAWETFEEYLQWKNETMPGWETKLKSPSCTTSDQQSESISSSTPASTSSVDYITEEEMENYREAWERGEISNTEISQLEWLYANQSQVPTTEIEEAIDYYEGGRTDPTFAYDLYMDLYKEDPSQAQIFLEALLEAKDEEDNYIWSDEAAAWFIRYTDTDYDGERFTGKWNWRDGDFVSTLANALYDSDRLGAVLYAYMPEGFKSYYGYSVRAVYDRLRNKILSALNLSQEEELKLAADAVRAEYERDGEKGAAQLLRTVSRDFGNEANCYAMAAVILYKMDDSELAEAILDATESSWIWYDYYTYKDGEETKVHNSGSEIRIFYEILTTPMEDLIQEGIDASIGLTFVGINPEEGEITYNNGDNYGLGAVEIFQLLYETGLAMEDTSQAFDFLKGILTATDGENNYLVSDMVACRIVESLDHRAAAGLYFYNTSLDFNKLAETLYNTGRAAEILYPTEMVKNHSDHFRFGLPWTPFRTELLSANPEIGAKIVEQAIKNGTPSSFIFGSPINDLLNGEAAKEVWENIEDTGIKNSLLSIFKRYAAAADQYKEDTLNRMKSSSPEEIILVEIDEYRFNIRTSKGGATIGRFFNYYAGFAWAKEI